MKRLFYFIIFFVVFFSILPTGINANHECWRMSSDLGGDVCDYNYYRPNSGEPFRACTDSGEASPENVNGNICCQKAGGTCSNSGFIWVTATCCLNHTPTPTPTPIPSCDSYTSCLSCTGGAPFNCGWTGLPGTSGNFCQTGKDVCPAGNSSWYWTQNDCDTGNNRCIVPSPTPTPIPTCSSFTSCSTCIVGGATCGWNGSACQTGTSSCPAGGTTWNFFSCSENLCAAPPPPPPLTGTCPSGLASECFQGNECVTPQCVNNQCVFPNKPNNTSCNTDGNACTQDVCSSGICTHPLQPVGTACNIPSNLCCNASGACSLSCSVTPIPTFTPTPTPTGGPTPTPTPVPCEVTTSPSVHNLAVGETGTVTASVTSGLGEARISRMRFGSYDTSVATVNRASDPSSPYATTVTAVTSGATAVWGTADLSDERICESTGGTDTDVNVSGPPPPPTSGGLPNGSPCVNNSQCASAFCNASTETCQNPPPPPPPFGQIRICDILIPASSTCFVCGYVYDDTNGNQVKDPGETGVPNASVLHSSATTASGCTNFTANRSLFVNPNPQLTNINGRYEYSFFAFQFPIFNACHKAEVTVPPGFIATNGSGNFVYGSSCFPIQLDLGIAVPNTISGTIFVDSNKNKIKDGNETNYLGSASVSYRGSIVNGSVSNSAGTYSINDLPPGQYTLTFSGLPEGSAFTYPTTSLIVSLGASCSVPVTSEGRCSSGNIISLNAGVTNSASRWFQSTGVDMRWDSGFSNILPQNKFASILGSGGMPGIIFSGTITPSFGQGQASQNPFNWKVSGNVPDTRDVFTDTHNLIPTSYRFLLETVDGSGIAKKTVRDLCSNGDSANCTLIPNLVNGVYWIDGNLALNGSGYTFPNSKDFVILINGNLNINEEIHIPIGSTAIFSAKEDIIVNRTIGETASSASQTIEGLYSADQDFVADGTNNCSGVPDLRLNVGGSVIANADRGNGTFVNNRDLCTGNSSFPSVSFIERPDFMLNYPSLVQQIPKAWQDVAP